MKPDSNVINPHEVIVRVKETSSALSRCFYAIYDRHLCYWRGKGCLEDYDAWTRDTVQRAEFDSRKEAANEMKAIWRWRLMREAERAAEAMEDEAA